MNLLLNILLYLGVGFGEWFLALKRITACAKGETKVLITIVFIENMLALWVLSNFVRENNWLLALIYSLGGSLGAFFVVNKTNRNENTDNISDNIID